MIFYPSDETSSNTTVSEQNHSDNQSFNTSQSGQNEDDVAGESIDNTSQPGQNEDDVAGESIDNTSQPGQNEDDDVSELTDNTSQPGQNEDDVAGESIDNTSQSGQNEDSRARESPDNTIQSEQKQDEPFYIAVNLHNTTTELRNLLDPININDNINDKINHISNELDWLDNPTIKEIDKYIRDTLNIQPTQFKFKNDYLKDMFSKISFPDISLERLNTMIHLPNMPNMPTMPDLGISKLWQSFNKSLGETTKVNSQSTLYGKDKNKQVEYGNSIQMPLLVLDSAKLFGGINPSVYKYSSNVYDNRVKMPFLVLNINELLKGIDMDSAHEKRQLEMPLFKLDNFKLLDNTFKFNVPIGQSGKGLTINEEDIKYNKAMIHVYSIVRTLPQLLENILSTGEVKNESALKAQIEEHRQTIFESLYVLLFAIRQTNITYLEPIGLTAENNVFISYLSSLFSGETSEEPATRNENQAQVDNDLYNIISGQTN